MKCFDNSKVRRQDRLLNEDAARELLVKGEFSFLSMVESRCGRSAGYGIPLNFVWDGDENIYFHCAPQGHKLECLDACPLVTLTIVGPTEVLSKKYTTNYSSILVRGCIERHLAESERMRALELLLDKYSPADKEVGMKYAAKSFHRTEILKMKIETVSGKEKLILP